MWHCAPVIDAKQTGLAPVSDILTFAVKFGANMTDLTLQQEKIDPFGGETKSFVWQYFGFYKKKDDTASEK